MNKEDLNISDFEQILQEAVQGIAKERQPDCPSFDDLYAFVERTLPQSRRRDIATHVAACAHCMAETGRIFKAHTHYERNRQRLLQRTIRRLKAEGWTPTTWWTVLLRLLGLAKTEPSGEAVSVRRLRPLAWGACGAIGILFLMSVFVATLFVHERGKNTGFREATALIQEDLHDVNRLLFMMATAQAGNVVREAGEIQVLELSTHVGQLPYPTLKPLSARQSVLAVEIDRHADLHASYTAFLEQWSKVFLQLGDVLVQTGKIEDAIKVFKYLTEKSPDNKPLLFTLGELYKMFANSDPEGDPERFEQYHKEAIAVYEEMLKRWPSDPRPPHYAGFSYFQLGDYVKALEYYDRALKIFPDYAKVYFNKALVYKEMPGLSKSERDLLFEENFQKALNLTKKAYKKQEESNKKQEESNPRVPFTLAVLYADLYAETGEKDKKDKALEHLEQAIRRNPFYITRAEKERAFEIFRGDPRFTNLLNRYRPAEHGRFGLEHEAEFNPNIFIE